MPLRRSTRYPVAVPGRCTGMSRWALIGVVLGTLACAGGASASLSPSGGGLCGISPTIDALLGCASTPPSPATGNSTTLRAGPPVRRVPVRPAYLPGVLARQFRADPSRARAAALLGHLHLRTVARIPARHVRTIVVPAARRASVVAALRASRLVADTG